MKVILLVTIILCMVGCGGSSGEAVRSNETSRKMNKKEASKNTNVSHEDIVEDVQEFLARFTTYSDNWDKILNNEFLTSVFWHNYLDTSKYKLKATKLTKKEIIKLLEEV